jgi:hypothetical protein
LLSEHCAYICQKFALISWNICEENFFELICTLCSKCETPFHYALRGPHSVRATVFETLMRRFNKPQDVLQKFLNMSVRPFCFFISSWWPSLFFKFVSMQFLDFGLDDDNFFLRRDLRVIVTQSLKSIQWKILRLSYQVFVHQINDTILNSFEKSKPLSHKNGFYSADWNSDCSRMGEGLSSRTLSKNLPLSFPSRTCPFGFSVSNLQPGYCDNSHYKGSKKSCRTPSLSDFRTLQKYVTLKIWMSLLQLLLWKVTNLIGMNNS